MNRYYVTFGQQYRTEAHPLNELVDPDGYATVNASSLESARITTTVALGNYWSDLLSEADFDASYYPLGELFTIY